MRPDPLVRTRHRTRRLAIDRFRAAIASASVAAIFFIGYFAGTHPSLFSGTPAAVSARSGVASIAVKNPNEWGHRVGSILFVPWSGDRCEQRRFDNATGQMLSTGFIKCEAQGDTTLPGWAHDNTTRMTAILNAFKK